MLEWLFLSLLGDEAVEGSVVVDDGLVLADVAPLLLVGAVSLKMARACVRDLIPEFKR